MLVTTMIHFAPRTVAQARAARAKHLGKLVRIGLRKLTRRITALRERIALAWQYERELAVLLQADDRMLADIGLTRADVYAAARTNWITPGCLANAAAQRRKDAMRAAEMRHGSSRGLSRNLPDGVPDILPHDLPELTAPALSPGTPARFITVETSNFT